MGDEHVPFQHAEKLRADIAKTRRVLDHVPRDVGQRGDGPGDRPVGIDQRIEDRFSDATVHANDGDLRDTVAIPGARAGGLAVDHDKRFVGETIVVLVEHSAGVVGAAHMGVALRRVGDDGPRCAKESASLFARLAVQGSPVAALLSMP